ncbi:MAG: hypothetical protein AAF688_09040 [Bacteroidota bacterium]
MPLKRILFAIFLLSLTACQEVDHEAIPFGTFELRHKDDINAFILSESEIPEHILGYVGSKTKNTFRVEIVKNRIRLTDEITNELGRETPLGTVLTNKVVQVYNEENTKYTFRVTNPQNAMSIINLVVVDTADGIIEYFIQYAFDPSYEVPYLDDGGVDMATFTGGLTFYNNIGDMIGTFILVNGQVMQGAGRTSPCDDNNTPPDDDDNEDEDSPGGGGPLGGNDQDGDDDPNGDSANDNGNSSGAGEFSNPDEDENSCGFTWTYQCNGGVSGPHQPDVNLTLEGGMCSGAGGQGNAATGIIIIEDTCTGNSVAFRGSQEPVDPCAGEVGVLIELPIEEDPHENHCAELKKLTDNAIIKNKLELLKLDAVDNSIKNERGFSIKMTSSGEVSSPTKTAEVGGISYKAYPDLFGVAHIHQAKGGNPMFSAMDLFALKKHADAYAYQGLGGDIISLPVYMLVTAHGTYAVKINDENAIQAYLNAFPTFKKQKREHFDLNKLYNKRTNPVTGQTHTNPKLYEEVLAKYIQNKGISLYKASQDLTSWKELEYDNASPNNLKETNCEQ